MKIMVVEDSREILERIVLVLNEMVGKNSVIAVDCVNQAISQIPEHRPNIILLDLLLPDGHGFDVLKMVKTHYWHTEVLVMTNDPNEQYEKRALKLGASHFFDKARDFNQMFTVIADIVAQSALDTKRVNG